MLRNWQVCPQRQEKQQITLLSQSTYKTSNTISMKFVKVENQVGNTSRRMKHTEWFKFIGPDFPVLNQLKEAEKASCMAAEEFVVGKRDIGKGLSRNSALSLLSKLSQPRRWTHDRSMTWLVRESGSFMAMDANTIIYDECHTDGNFPIEGKLDVVVCENDHVNRYMEKFWPATFAGKSIKSLNGFSEMPVSEIVTYFNEVKTVAFRTSFSDWGWWEKLIEAWEASDSKPKVVGCCFSDLLWDQARSMAPFPITRIEED